MEPGVGPATKPFANRFKTPNVWWNETTQRTLNHSINQNTGNHCTYKKNG
jgi:hypothetical protein